MSNDKLFLLRIFLEKLDVIRKKYQDIDARKDQFNIFTALLDKSDEVKLHSQFIYSLLNFKSGNEYRYLNAFLKSIDSSFEYNIDSLEIYKEKHDIDIWLIDRSTKQSVIVENKIYAPDSNHENEGQLEKYYRIVIEDEKIPEDNIEVYYLTLDGHEPSTESVSTRKKYPKLREKVQCISYPNEIVRWLQECMPFVYDKPFQRETIIQYIKLINDMTNGVDIEERIEIKKLIGESKGNLESAKLLVDNIKHLHWHTIADFWNGMVDELEKRGYKVSRKPKEDDFSDIVHGGSRKKNSASLLIEIKTLYPYNVQLKESSVDRLFFGVGKDKKLPKPYVLAFETLVANSEDYEVDKDNKKLGDDKKWYIWKCPSITEDEDIDSWDINKDATFNLIDDNYRRRITKAIVDEIDSFIKDVEDIASKIEPHQR